MSSDGSCCLAWIAVHRPVKPPPTMQTSARWLPCKAGASSPSLNERLLDPEGSHAVRLRGRRRGGDRRRRSPCGARNAKAPERRRPRTWPHRPSAARERHLPHSGKAPKAFACASSKTPPCSTRLRLESADKRLEIAGLARAEDSAWHRRAGVSAPASAGPNSARRNGRQRYWCRSSTPCCVGVCPKSCSRWPRSCSKAAVMSALPRTGLLGQVRGLQCMPSWVTGSPSYCSWPLASNTPTMSSIVRLMAYQGSE